MCHFLRARSLMCFLWSTKGGATPDLIPHWWISPRRLGGGFVKIIGDFTDCFLAGCCSIPYETNNPRLSHPKSGGDGCFIYKVRMCLRRSGVITNRPHCVFYVFHCMNPQPVQLVILGREEPLQLLKKYLILPGPAGGVYMLRRDQDLQDGKLQSQDHSIPNCYWMWLSRVCFPDLTERKTFFATWVQEIVRPVRWFATLCSD